MVREQKIRKIQAKHMVIEAYKKYHVVLRELCDVTMRLLDVMHEIIDVEARAEDDEV